MRSVLISCGATKNPIDAIRYLSAHSSGRTGLWLADHLQAVHLLGSTEACLRGADLASIEEFGSTDDLGERMHSWVTANPSGVVVHAAAVGDYTAANPTGKIPSGKPELTLELRPTTKILDQIRSWSAASTIFSFKAAPPGTALAELERLATDQLERTDCEAVFANTIGNLSQDIIVLDRTGPQHYATRPDALNGQQIAFAVLNQNNRRDWKTDHSQAHVERDKCPHPRE